MVKKNNRLLNKKLNGIYYTPSTLAEFFVSPLIDKFKLKIFDPSYGDGALLLAAEKWCKAFRINYELHGCDKSPVNGYLKHVGNSNLVKKDFFRYLPESKFDLILMNPPYVRHHRIKSTKKIEYQRTVNQLCELKQTSDLWAYFLVKSVKHLENGGSIGAILPWSFLQADYAQNIRIWLAERFGTIRVLSLGSDYFENAEERVILMWLWNYGEKARSIEIAFSQHIEEKIKYSNISLAKWGAGSIFFSDKNDIDEILSEHVNKFNFVRFGQNSNIKIGVVTGANDFFIMSKEKAKEIGISRSDLVPILTTSKEFHGLHFNGYKPSLNLLRINHNHLPRDYMKYIRKGRKYNYHLRAHSLNRNPWYSIDTANPPDAFFPYRSTYAPYLSLNDSNIQCTNSIHRVYFNNLTVTQIKWMQISLLSAPGQLSLEAFSKIYGKGILKIEPGSLKNSIVYMGKNKVPESIYNSISALVASNNKRKAVEVATELINKELSIPKHLASETMAALAELQQRRLNR